MHSNPVQPTPEQSKSPQAEKRKDDADEIDQEYRPQMKPLQNRIQQLEKGENRWILKSYKIDAQVKKHNMKKKEVEEMYLN